MRLAEFEFGGPLRETLLSLIESILGSAELLLSLPKILFV